MQFIVQPVPTLDQQAPGYRMMPIVILIENVHLKKKKHSFWKRSFGKYGFDNSLLQISEARLTF